MGARDSPAETGTDLCVLEKAVQDPGFGGCCNYCHHYHCHRGDDDGDDFLCFVVITTVC